jgi:hypothetical protein
MDTLQNAYLGNYSQNAHSILTIEQYLMIESYNPYQKLRKPTDILHTTPKILVRASVQ